MGSQESFLEIGAGGAECESLAGVLPTGLVVRVSCARPHHANPTSLQTSGLLPALSLPQVCTYMKELCHVLPDILWSKWHLTLPVMGMAGHRLWH